MPGKLARSIVLTAAALSLGSPAAQAQQERHAHGFAKDVDAFHSALAPLWHARAGQERSRHVCEQAPRLESLAKEIRSADSRPLLASIAALRTQCGTDPGAVDAAFAQVHEAFHRLAEAGDR